MVHMELYLSYDSQLFFNRSLLSLCEDYVKAVSSERDSNLNSLDFKDMRPTVQQNIKNVRVTISNAADSV